MRFQLDERQKITDHRVVINQPRSHRQLFLCRVKNKRSIFYDILRLLQAML